MRMALKRLAVVGLALASCALAELANETVSDECAGEPGTEPYNSDTDVAYVAAFYGNGHPMDLPSDNDAILVPYAVNKCQSSGPLGDSTAMIKFVCDADGNGFTLSQHVPNDVWCQAQATAIFHYDNDDSSLSAPFSFNCGASDAYAAFQLTLRTLNSVCYTHRINYFALNSCISSFLPPDLESSAYSMYYCNETGAVEIFFAETAQLCSSDEYCVSSPTYARDECQVFIANDDPNLDILIKNVDCVSIDLADWSNSSELFDLTTSTTTDAPDDVDSDSDGDGFGDDAGDDDDDDGHRASSGKYSGGFGVMAVLSTVFLLIQS